MIYFAKSNRTMRIKIGKSMRLRQRLKQLEVLHGEQLDVLGIMDGYTKEERELHRKFDHLNVRHEWFLPEPELLSFIARNGRPWDGKDEVFPGDGKLSLHIRCSEAWLRRLEEAKDERNLPSVTYLVEVALRDYFETNKMKPLPRR